MLRLPDFPTAIFAANDLSAIRVMEVAVELGCEFPTTSRSSGLDNVPEAANAMPPLTTLAQPLQQRGAEAVRLLLALLGGDATGNTSASPPAWSSGEVQHRAPFRADLLVPVNWD